MLGEDKAHWPSYFYFNLQPQKLKCPMKEQSHQFQFSCELS